MSQKKILFGALFCFLLFGGWALIHGNFGDVGEPEQSGLPVNPVDSVDSVDPETSGQVSLPGAGKVSEKARDSPVVPPDLPASFTNSIGIEFVLVPAGEFLMGSPETEAGRQADESPLHTVRIEKPFYMGKYEVTRAQWSEVMGSAGEFDDSFSGYSGLPVAEVSWDDARAFITKLNEMEGTDKYRLPSEAEWEYACRAGSSTKYSFGSDESELVEYAWFGNSPGSAPHPVGQKAPNAWGLYDMHGNVWEWVQDTWHNDYSEVPRDGRVWESGDLSRRVARGGSVIGSAESCRAANRAWFGSDVRNADMGFRLLMEV